MSVCHICSARPCLRVSLYMSGLVSVSLSHGTHAMSLPMKLQHFMGLSGSGTGDDRGLSGGVFSQSSKADRCGCKCEGQDSGGVLRGNLHSRRLGEAHVMACALDINNIHNISKAQVLPISCSSGMLFVSS